MIQLEVLFESFPDVNGKKYRFLLFRISNSLNWSPCFGHLPPQPKPGSKQTSDSSMRQVRSMVLNEGTYRDL